MGRLTLLGSVLIQILLDRWLGKFILNTTVATSN